MRNVWSFAGNEDGTLSETDDWVCGGVWWGIHGGKGYSSPWKVNHHLFLSLPPPHSFPTSQSTLGQAICSHRTLPLFTLPSTWGLWPVDTHQWDCCCCTQAHIQEVGCYFVCEYLPCCSILKPSLPPTNSGWVCLVMPNLNYQLAMNYYARQTTTAMWWTAVFLFVTRWSAFYYTIQALYIYVYIMYIHIYMHMSARLTPEQDPFVLMRDYNIAHATRYCGKPRAFNRHLHVHRYLRLPYSTISP